MPGLLPKGLSAVSDGRKVFSVFHPQGLAPVAASDAVRSLTSVLIITVQYSEKKGIETSLVYGTAEHIVLNSFLARST
uniref:Uncharacterized protein n=1 Tax=Anguilla anguilla TaxID=7936 RepID=A0A0E9WDA8_ANGAN